MGSLGVSSAQGAEQLSLSSYLIQVKEGNTGVKGAVLSAQGGQLRSEEGTLLLAPTVYSNLQYSRDGKLSQITLLGYSSLDTQNYSLGVSQLTTFGLQAKLHYDILYQSYDNPYTPPSLTGFNIPTSFANASPILELTQNLWSNAFGASTRATQVQLVALSSCLQLLCQLSS